MLKLLRNAKVYSPEPLGMCDLLIAGEKVVAIEQKIDLPASLRASEVDLEGQILCPGFIDAHVHLIGGGGESGPASRVPPLQLSQLTRAGITTCVGVLGTDGTTRNVADLVARTLGLREEGLSAYCYTGSYQFPVPTLTGSIRTDIVYVDPIIGVGELALSDHRSSQLTFDELLRVAADTHVAGMMSGKAGILHLHMGDGPRGLELVQRAVTQSELPAKVFQPTHINRNPRLFAQAMELANLGIPMDVTAFPEQDLGEAYSAADAIDQWIRAQLPLSQLTCSSDSGGCMPSFDDAGRIVQMGVGSGQTLQHTLQNLCAMGHPLETILPAFTSNVAHLLRWPHKGRIEVRADADFVILNSQHQVVSVMARGKWMVRDHHCEVVGPFDLLP